MIFPLCYYLCLQHTWNFKMAKQIVDFSPMFCFLNWDVAMPSFSLKRLFFCFTTNQAVNFPEGKKKMFIMEMLTQHSEECCKCDTLLQIVL